MIRLVYQTLPRTHADLILQNVNEEEIRFNTLIPAANVIKLFFILH
jgi:hypothetical protein